MGLLFALGVCILVTWALIDFMIYFHKLCDYREAERKRPKQVQLDDLLGTRNYNGPLG
jgi:hypothetical protein